MSSVSLYKPSFSYGKDIVKANIEGNKLYKMNSNMRDLLDLMQDDKFRRVFTTHFNTWDDVKTVIILMKVYELIEQNYPKLSPKARLYILNEAIKNANTRECMFRQANEQMNRKEKMLT